MPHLQEMKSCKSKLKLLRDGKWSLCLFHWKIINFMESGKRNSILGHNKRFRRKKEGDFVGTILSSSDVEKSWKNNWFNSLGLGPDRFRNINRTHHTRRACQAIRNIMIYWTVYLRVRPSIKWKSLFSFAFLMLPKYWCFLCVWSGKKGQTREVRDVKGKHGLKKYLSTLCPRCAAKVGKDEKGGRKTEKW